MKYYSEKLNKVFNTAKELKAAEAAAVDTPVEDTKAPVEEHQTESKIPTKKQLATEVEVAEEALKKAYSDYELAKKQVEELSKKYLEETNKILEPAKKVVKDAEQAKYDAINRFNTLFGPYQVIYTGSRAADEMLKAINDINARSRSIFDSLFWF